MSDGGGLQVLDGAHLTAAADSTLPELSDGGMYGGARVLEIASSRASECLYGLPLPEKLKSASLQRLNSELSGYSSQEKLDQEQAQRLLRGFITAIADELRDDPLVVSVLDGNTVRLFLEDEDDFAMLAENLFTELDTEDDGKLSKSEIQSALVHMGVEMGVPPLSDFPVINDILKKHGAEGEEKLGQAQFAELLQPILQDLADALAINPVTVVQNVKIINGSKLRKLLADTNKVDQAVEKIYEEIHNQLNGEDCTEMIRSYLEKNGEELGLPPLEANEEVILMYDSIFSDIAKEKRGMELKKNEFQDLLKQILQKFAEQLQANPVFHEIMN